MDWVVEMDKEKELPKRKATRLNNFDYNSVGAYFITICTQNRRCILSRIVGTVRPYLLRKWTVHKNNRPPNPIRPRSFAASPHAVILEQSEESRGATPLEDDTGGGEGSEE